jgi:NAD+ kinase
VTNSFSRIAFLASTAPEAMAARDRLVRYYGDADPESADVVVALGGDGLMLQALHRFMGKSKPIYGMNRGSVGFLMNEFSEMNLRERLAAAERSIVHPLLMHAPTTTAHITSPTPSTRSICFRQTYQAAKLAIAIDGRSGLPELTCDGVMVATPAGSTAYNYSANGPILPLNAHLLALTPISAFRPRRWRGAILPEHAAVSITVQEADKRPVSAVADHFETRNVIRVDIKTDTRIDLLMLHDPGHSLDERILREQFGY